MIRVSDIITKEEIRKWNKDEIVSISAGTGVGKSYFIKNVLYDVAKENNEKILMLVNRSILKEQFEIEIQNDEKDDIITVMTYQKLQANLLHKSDIDYIYMNIIT